VSAIPSLIPSPATFSNYVSVFSHKTAGGPQAPAMNRVDSGG
jgi:hypothetical protein